MESIAGFLLINVYALLLILATCIMFFSKQRLKQIEDEIYKKFLLINVCMSFSGLILGIFVSPNYFNESIAVLFNKLYLISLLLWICVLTIYTLYVSLKDKIKKYNKVYMLFIVVCVLLILMLPLNVELNSNSSAIATGPGVLLTYLVFGFGFLIQVVSLIANYKNLSNKKYIPLYLLIVLGSSILLIQIINPSLNYLINPVLIFIAYIMFHTIENPDMKLLEELHKSKEISDSANEEKTMFLYNMTQDIRNTTNEIDDNVNMILDSDNVDEIHDYARDIKVVTSRFNSMTNDILDISKLDDSNIKIYNNKYSIKTIIKEFVTMYGNICKNRNIDFRSNIDHDIPDTLYGDSISLKEAISIVLDNSSSNTKEGYIEFNVNAIIKNNVCRLIITIEDSGTGIKSDELEKVKVKGKSLGRANKLITLMGGTMMLSSNYGYGTKVKIILDQRIEMVSDDTVTKYSEVFDDINLLMVDDSEAGIKIIDKLLKGSNIKIDSVGNGKDCLDLIKVKKYDIILIDEELSQITGAELLKKIHGIRNFKTPVILLTKDNNYEYNEEYKKLGFNDYILKPVKKDILLNKINECLKKDK